MEERLHSEMQLGERDTGLDAPESERDDITLVDADEVPEKLPAEPAADEYEKMQAIAFDPILDEPEILVTDHFTWNIENWRHLPKKMHSPVFEAGGYKWRVLFFPVGNDNVDTCSLYLELYDGDNMADDFHCCVQFSLVLWNPNDPRLHTKPRSANHRFVKGEADWGFQRFESLRDLIYKEWNGSSRPLVENEAANLTVYLRVVKDETGILWHSFREYDSKKETGYVGLKNQGATCYLNSLLQSLYFTNAFRKAVYQIPTEHEANLMNSAYTLQRLFYQLQTSKNAVSTNELTKSFGWQTRHIFEQQDVQELSRKLMERMEDYMKGTAAENVLPQLFCGKVKTYISCIDVDYESSRVEDFWDIQLNVRGNKNIEESFKDYVQVEKMDGENQYFAGEKYKLQDANKGVIFQSFPEVLNLQLKRFEYDIEHDAMMKINDRYEFPEVFDASPYLSDDADKSEPYIYQLHGVLVHAGDLNAGHYYAFIKPTKDGWFYKYDDDRVTRATKREVLEDNFGGEAKFPPGFLKGANAPIRQNSAYMLVYIRQSRIDEVLQPVTEDDSPAHLQRRLKEEQAHRDALKKEREEQHLYMNVQVVSDKTFREHSGVDVGLFNIPRATPGAAKTYRMAKTSTLRDLAEKVAEDLNQDARRIRFRPMINRQNKTVRPDTPFSDDSIPLEKTFRMASSSAEYRAWAEVAEEVDETGKPIWNAPSEKIDSILLFLKWFDVENQKLQGIGHFYIGQSRKVSEILPIIYKKMGWAEKGADKPQLKFYEESIHPHNGYSPSLTLFKEIKPQMIDTLNLDLNIKAAELQDGDIICFQKCTPKSAVEDKGALAGATFSKLVGSVTQKPQAVEPVNGVSQRPADWIEDVPHFYDYLMFRKVVRFSPHPRNVEPYGQAIDVEMSSKFTYDQITARVGERLEVEPTHLRFHTINASSGNLKPLKRNINQSSQTLQNILNPTFSTFGNSSTKSDELCYEVLEISLSELETKKLMKVTWLSEGITKEEIYDILAPRTGFISDVINLLIQKAKLKDEATKGPIRVYGVHNNKVYKEFGRDYSVMSITDFVSVVAERVPGEERHLKDFIHCFHFQGEPQKSHGIPFKFAIKEGEKFVDTRKRLEKRTGFKGKNFEKIKFAVVKRGGSYAKPVYLQGDDVLWDVAPNEDDLLGLDHPDRSSRNRSVGPDLFLK